MLNLVRQECIFSDKMSNFIHIDRKLYVMGCQHPYVKNSRFRFLSLNYFACSNNHFSYNNFYSIDIKLSNMVDIIFKQFQFLIILYHFYKKNVFYNILYPPIVILNIVPMKRYYLEHRYLLANISLFRFIVNIYIHQQIVFLCLNRS